MLIEWLTQFKQNNQISLLDIHLALFLTNKAELNDDITEIGRASCRERV